MSEHKQFLLDIISKVKFKEYKFSFDSISYPTDEQVERLKSGDGYQHRLSITIVHYGPDNDKGKESEMHWLTFFGYVMISEWTEEAVTKAIFIALIQKLRHEASEVFQYEDNYPFHEHRNNIISIP